MSKSNRVLMGIFLIAIVLITVIAFLFTENEDVQTSSNSITSVASDIRVVDETDSEIEKKKTRIRNLGQLTKNAQEKSRSLRESDAVEMPEIEMTPELERQKELRDKTDPYYWEMAPAIVEDMWSSGEIDKEWSSAIQEAADKIIPKGKYEGTEVSQIDCRQPLCKIGFTHDSVESYSTFHDGDMDKGPWLTGAGHGMGGYKELDKGKIESFIYFTKEGDFETFFKVREKIADIKNIWLTHQAE